MTTTPVSVAAVALALSVLATVAQADIFARKGPDGVTVFTDAPVTSDFNLVIKNGPRILPWREYAAIIAERADLDPLLVRAVIMVESGKDPAAVSSKGAVGLMQLMPETARDLGVDDPQEPRQNIKGGVWYLAKMLKRFDGRPDLALAAYNAGPGNVEKYGDIPPFPETRNFVKKVLKIYRAAKSLETP